MAALSREPAMQVAQDKAPTKLLFKKLETVSGWQEIVVIALGDQARNNRPDGGSTGGLASFLGGPGHLQGRPGPLSLVSYWRLGCVAISSNDPPTSNVKRGWCNVPTVGCSHVCHEATSPTVAVYLSGLEPTPAREKGARAAMALERASRVQLLSCGDMMSILAGLHHCWLLWSLPVHQLQIPKRHERHA